MFITLKDDEFLFSEQHFEVRKEDGGKMEVTK